MHKAAMEARTDDPELFIYDKDGNIIALNDKYYRVYPGHFNTYLNDYIPDRVISAPELAAFYIILAERPPHDRFEQFTDLNGFIKAIEAALTKLGYPTDFYDYPLGISRCPDKTHKAVMEKHGDRVNLFMYDTSGNIIALNEKYYILEPGYFDEFYNIDIPKRVVPAPELAAEFILTAESPIFNEFKRYKSRIRFIAAIKEALTKLGHPTDIRAHYKKAYGG